MGVFAESNGADFVAVGVVADVVETGECGVGAGI
jgi:hypothetical protein